MDKYTATGTMITMNRNTMADYDNRLFVAAQTTANSEVNTYTIFHYHQKGDIVWATYQGGRIQYGQLIATVDAHGTLDGRYQHVNIDGEIMTGVCKSTPEFLPDGRMRLRETWQWTCGDGSSGESIVEEVRRENI